MTRLALRLVRLARADYSGPLDVSGVAPCLILSHVVWGEARTAGCVAPAGWLMLHPAGVRYRETAVGPGRHEFLFVEADGTPSLDRLPDAFPLRSPAAYSALFDRATAGDGLTLATILTEAVASFEASGLAPRAEPPAMSRFAGVVGALRERHLSRAEMAAMAGLDPNHFDRAYGAEYREAPSVTARRFRLGRLQAALAATDAPLDAIARAEGLSEGSALIRLFRTATGETPQTFRRRVRGDASVERYVRSFEDPAGGDTLFP